ncbi:MAG: ATP-dependent zinc protease [Gammaproteobacteria bacterium]|nr:ATP-dependent zinc protease [Gammaproteobacteria bacterium]
MFKRTRAIALLIPSLALVAPGTAWSDPESATHAVLGWVERITLEPWGFTIKARLDTGAQTSSMQAERIERFDRGNREWARFILELDDAQDEDGRPTEPGVEVERPVVRDALIKEFDGSYDRRPVVTLEFCLNGRRFNAEFSLKDRSLLTYPALLGRGFLADIALIDPGKTFLGTGACPPCPGVEPARQ